MLFVKQLAVLPILAGYISHASAGLPFVRMRETPTPAISTNTPQSPMLLMTEALVSVQQTIQSVENMPSCNQIAAKNLLQSCESFKDLRDGTSGDTHLEIYQQVFAIRTTNCEMMHANLDMPDICKPLLDPDLRDMPSDKSKIPNCINALYSQGTNRWTTYQRLKSDALLMCHVLRVQADKDDMIHLHKILFSAMADVNGALHWQQGEFDSFATQLSEVSGQMNGFRDAMYRDNQEIKASLMAFSHELKGNMTDISENAQELLQRVSDAKRIIVDYAAQVDSAFQLANARRDETDLQFAAKHEDNLERVRQRYDYAFQQLLADFHSSAFDMSQSVNVANDLTSNLVRKLAEFEAGLDRPIAQVTELNAGLDGMATKQLLTAEVVQKTYEVAASTNKLVGGVMSYVQDTYLIIQGLLSALGSFSIYFAVIFIAVFCCMWLFVSHLWAPFAATAISLYLSVTFVWIHSPIAFAKSVIAHHPVFFMSPYWSMVAVGAIAIASYKAMERVCGYVYSSPTDNHESQLPRDEQEGVVAKV